MLSLTDSEGTEGPGLAKVETCMYQAGRCMYQCQTLVRIQVRVACPVLNIAL